MGLPTASGQSTVAALQGTGTAAELAAPPWGLSETRRTRMKMEFGAVDHIDRQDKPIWETYDSRLKLVEMYDKAGFSTFHLTEHHFTPLGLAPSPLIFLAAASRITEKIHFAPLVLITTLYNPLRLASEICMMDHLTKGRIEFGTGRGVSPYELRYFNVEPKEAPEIYR